MKRTFILWLKWDSARLSQKTRQFFSRVFSVYNDEHLSHCRCDRTWFAKTASSLNIRSRLSRAKKTVLYQILDINRYCNMYVRVKNDHNHWTASVFWSTEFQNCLIPRLWSLDRRSFIFHLSPSVPVRPRAPPRTCSASTPGPWGPAWPPGPSLSFLLACTRARGSWSWSNSEPAFSSSPVTQTFFTKKKQFGLFFGGGERWFSGKVRL
jgi:hypothetical protein